MKVKIPKQIKLGVHSYGIRYNSHLRCDEGSVGCSRHRSQVIEIEPDQADSQKYETFIHEVLHIIDRQYSCRLDEDDVDRIAEGFADFLFNNLGIELDWSEIE